MKKVKVYLIISSFIFILPLISTTKVNNKETDLFFSESLKNDKNIEASGDDPIDEKNDDEDDDDDDDDEGSGSETSDNKFFIFDDYNNPPKKGSDTPTTSKEDIDNNINLIPDSSLSGQKQINKPTSFFAQPGILAAVIGGAVVGLLCAIHLVMFIVYRMRKKDEGSYEVESKAPLNPYGKSSKDCYRDT